MSNNEHFDLICQNISFKRTAIACKFHEHFSWITIVKLSKNYLSTSKTV